MRFITILLVCLFAVPAIAGTTWSNKKPHPTAGRNTSNYTPTTTTGDDQTATLPTRDCESITVSCYGADLTGLLQMCNAEFPAAQTDAVLECQDVNLTALNCASNHSVQVEPAPAWIRLASVTGSDSTQFFQVVCTGSLK